MAIVNPPLNLTFLAYHEYRMTTLSSLPNRKEVVAELHKQSIAAEGSLQKNADDVRIYVVRATNWLNLKDATTIDHLAHLARNYQHPFYCIGTLELAPLQNHKPDRDFLEELTQQYWIRENLCRIIETHLDRVHPIPTPQKVTHFR